MAQTIEATFDGNVFRPTEPVTLPPNSRVRLIVENIAASTKPAADPYEFLRIAREAKLDGPEDWSENVDKYLYGNPHNE